MTASDANGRSHRRGGGSRNTVRCALAFLLLALPAGAEIPEPDHIFYGRPTLAGAAPEGGVVSAVLRATGETIATYRLGSDPAVGDQFVVRVPLDAVDPRRPGTARPGDPIQFFLTTPDGDSGTVSRLAGEAVVEGRGTVTNLNIDPEGLEIPTLTIRDATVVEGDAGTVVARLDLVLSPPAAEQITVQWATEPGTATTLDSDYLADADAVVFGLGDTTATIEVRVVGDVAIETDEDFFVRLTAPASPTIDLPRDRGKVTILDDDTPPTISIGNVTVSEPTAPGTTTTAVFRVSLSHVWDVPVSVDYATVPGTATANVDYLSDSGMRTIAPGFLSTTIPIEVLHDLVNEADETFTVELSNPVVGSLADAVGQGTITDDQRFLVFEEQEVEGASGVTGLLGARSVAVSRDGRSVYAVGSGSNALTVFSRDPATGLLTFDQVLVQGVDGVDGMTAPVAVAVTPTDDFVYVASRGLTDVPAAVAVFQRDLTEGALGFGRLAWNGFVELGETQGAKIVDGIDHPRWIGLDPDPDGSDPLTGGDHVYVVGRSGVGDTSGDAAIAVFERDPTSGLLEIVDVEIDGVDDGDDAGPAVTGAGGAWGAAFSPDGAHLYVAAESDSSVAIFAREADPMDANYGWLTFNEAVVDGASGADGLDRARDVAVSPDGGFVYVASTGESSLGALGVFARNTDDGDVLGFGDLSFVQVVKDTDSGVDGLAGALAVETGPRGDVLYVAGLEENPDFPGQNIEGSLAAFRRNAATGTLSFIERKLDERGGVDGLWVASDLAVAPDDRTIYVTASLDHAVSVFSRDLDPPDNPTSLLSTTHEVDVWSNLDVVEVEWSGASDPGHSGLEGYSVLFDTTPDTTPDEETLEVAHVADPHGTASDPLGDDDGHWFHLRTCDRSGNCAVSAVHLGPFKIDTVVPTDPGTVSSSTHAVGVPSTLSQIQMTWTAGADDASGVDGYSFAFTGSSTTVCDETKDVEEAATAALSGLLPNGDYWFHLCTVDNAGNWSSGTTVGPFTVATSDTTAPTVVRVTSVSGRRGDPAIQVRDSLTNPVTQLEVHFSESLSSSLGSPDDPAAYLLARPGPDGVFQTSSCSGGLAGDDVATAIVTALYPDPSVVLGFDGFGAIPAGRYRFSVCAGEIVDPSGNLLDGDRDGSGGDDYSIEFTVALEHLLLNPTFDFGNLSFWVPEPSGTPEISYSGDDRDDALTSGSAEIFQIGSGPRSFAISQCVDLAQPEARHRIGAELWLQSPSETEPEAFGSLIFLDAANCAGSQVGVFDTMSLVPGPDGPSGTWTTMSAAVAPPVGSASVVVSYVVSTVAENGFLARFDDLVFAAEDPQIVFRDGFEAGDVSAWSDSAP